jgi:hypothetical protein
VNDDIRMTIARFPGAALAFVVVAQTAPAMAQVTADSLRGKSITATVQYEVQARREGRGEFTAPVTAEWRLNIGTDDRVTGSISRTSVSPRGPVSTSRPISAVIGKPGRPAGGGHGLILLSGNTLTLLRTFEVGGIKTTITLTGGGGCTIHAPIMKEVGAGPTRRDAIAGGMVEIISSKQVSSTCRVQ